MIDALLVCFGPTYYENLDGMLARLQQGIGIVQIYQQFKRIANRVEGWSHCALMASFIEGLRNDIGQEVLIFQPSTLQEAMVLARCQEEKLNRLQE